MWRLIKKLPLAAVAGAVVFLLIRVVCDLLLPTLTAGIINRGVIPGDLSAIWWLGAWMLGLSLVGFGAAMVNNYLSARIAYQFGCRLRKSFYAQVGRFSNVEYERIGAASLITRNTNDITQVQGFVEMGLKFMILAPMYLAGGMVMAWRLSPSLSMCFWAALPFITLTAIGVSVYANPLYLRMQRGLDGLNLIFREGLNGVKVIRAFNKEEREYRRYERENAAYAQTSIHANTAMSLLMPVLMFIMSMTGIAITWLGGHAVARGGMDVGTIIGVIAYSTQILMGFMVLTNIITFIPRGEASARRINEVLEMPLSIRDPETPKPLPSGPVALSLDGVSYQYPGAEKNAVEDVGFSVEPGQVLAIVGGTGSGKTTVLNLILRFYEVTGGAIRLGPVDIRDLTQTSRHGAISFAPQQSLLFQGTVRSNLLMGRPDATDDEMWSALETARADRFVRKLEGGLDGVVDKEGGNFSGGQRQRLCIARALIKPAAAYLFDDSFSALDFKTDAQVRTAMKKRLAGAITVIVAQRISTVMDADRIAVLDAGRLVGLGTHEELKTSNEVYREIIQSQFERGAAK